MKASLPLNSSTPRNFQSNLEVSIEKLVPSTKQSNSPKFMQFTSLDDLLNDEDVIASSALIDKVLVSSNNPVPPSTNNRITGKRSHTLSETEFPPMTKASSYYQFPPTTPNAKKFQSNSYNNVSQITCTPTVNHQPTSTTLYNFQPKTLADDYKSTCYVASSLRLDQLMREVEMILNLNDTDNFQRIHMDFNNVEYSWNVFFMKSTHHCQLKLRILQIKPTDTRFNSSSQRRYLLDAVFEDGDKSLYYFLFHLVKDAIVQFEDGFTQQLTYSMQSFGLQDSTSMKSEKSSTENSSKMMKSISITTPPLISNSAGEKILNSVFYSTESNYAILMKWKKDLLQFDFPVLQLEAIKNFLNLCQSSSAQKDFQMFQILESEDLQLISSLLLFFGLKVEANQSMSGFHLVHHDEEVWIKPYIVQIFKCFMGSPRAMNLMSSDVGLRTYLSKVGQVKNPSKLKLIIDDCGELIDAILNYSFSEDYSFVRATPNPTSRPSSTRSVAVHNMDMFSPMKCSSLKSKVY